MFKNKTEATTNGVKGASDECVGKLHSGATGWGSPFNADFLLALNLMAAIILTLSGPGPAWAGSPGPGAGGPSAPTVVLVSPVKEQEVNPPLEFLGRVEAVQAVDLRARVRGFLEKVLFREGSLVKAGDLLFQIEQDSYQAQVEIDQAKAASAEAALKKAEQYLARLKNVTSGGVSASDLETAVSDHLQAKAALQEAQATLTQAKLDLGYTLIKAPIGGLIGATSFTRGNLVGTDSGSLAKMVQVDPIRVVFSFSETELPDRQKEMREHPVDYQKGARIFKLRLANGDLYDHTGKLDFVDNEVDPETGTIAIRALFDNPDGSLMPGQFVTVVDSARQGQKMPVVPQAAVLEDKEGRYVFVVDSNNRTVQRRIATGPVVGTGWVVESGLMSGEMVIVQGVQKVTAGQEVSPTTEDAR
ncbi:MAG: efflux RND transporter periplasmic adaptor subunit [Pseudomonadota bacterium]